MKKNNINVFTAFILNCLTIAGNLFVVLPAVAEPITIVITGSTIPTEEQRTVSSTFLIQKEDIEKRNPRSISQLLQLVPGLYVENASNRGSLSTVYLRGAEPNYTLVMIDGVKVNDPSNSRGGAFDFSLLDINSVERIEVVKGSLSSVYGSDAMAGVINIITQRTADTPKTVARVEAGSRELVNAQVSTVKRFDKGQLSINVGYTDDGEQIGGSEFIAKSFNANGEFDVSPASRLSMYAYFQDASAESFPEASGGDDYAVIRDLDQTESTQQHYSMKLKNKISESENVNVQIGYFRNEETFETPGVDLAIPAYNSDTDYQRQNLLLSYLFQPVQVLDASLGIEMEQEDGNNKGVIDPNGFNAPTDFELNRKLYASFVELQYAVTDNVLMMAGLRLDAADDFDNEVSPRVGMSYRHNETTYRASWSEGFKLPSFFALAHPIVGNPDFQPETSESFEIGIRHNAGDSIIIDASLFQHTYFDLIDFDDSGVLVQRSEVVTKGIEFSVTQDISKQLSLQLHYTALSFDIKDSADDIFKRPERLAGVSLSWQMSQQLLFSGQANYTGKVKDFAYPTGVRTLDSHVKVDVAVNWQWSEAWHSQFAIDNLLNEDYEQAIGVEAPGIGVRFALKSSF